MADLLDPSQHLRVVSQDRIDLFAIDAKITTALTIKAFAFIGASSFTGAGLLRAVTNATTNRTIIEGDVDGDRVADFQLQLVGLKTVALTDFIAGALDGDGTGAFSAGSGEGAMMTASKDGLRCGFGCFLI